MPKKEAFLAKLTLALYFFSSFHQIWMIFNIETEITANLLLWFNLELLKLAQSHDQFRWNAQPESDALTV